MRPVVVKFGGTSLATEAAIKTSVEIVRTHLEIGQPVIVVTSAMGKTTDRLLRMAKRVGPAEIPDRELDLLLSSGERISMSLFSIALAGFGIRARSYTGSQVGIITDTTHARARIIEVKGDRIRRDLELGIIPIIAGFQGVSTEKEVTTLGRGGSDITALALAAAFDCKQCYLYTDVEGISTEDPSIFSGVKLISSISFDEMFELSTRGARVIHPRACAIAARRNIEIWIGKGRGTGTWIKGGRMEKTTVKAITHQNHLHIITMVGVPKRRGSISQVITKLAKAGIGIRFFFHGAGQDRFDLSFVLSPEDGKKAGSILKSVNIREQKIKYDRNLGSVTLVGYGVGINPEILNRAFGILEREKIHIEAVTTSELSITCIIKGRDVKGAVKALLKEFYLTDEDHRRP